MPIEPFTVHVDDDVLADLDRRLEHARLPDQAPGEAWTFGIPVEVMQEVTDHWRHRYDWRAREAAINAWPNFVTEAAGERVHFIHVRSPEPDATPIVLTHGWPGSFVEFLDVIGPLSDPVAHGGDTADAFHVVVPSMPGYGFSGPTVQAGFDADRVADAVAELMAQLGYDRYIAQGGDWGSIVTRRLGEAYGDRLLGVHFNMLFAFPAPDDPDPMAGVTDAEMERFGAMGPRLADGTGYMAIQSTKPQTLAYGLTDSPAGLAAWLVEKYRTWSDCDGDVERAFTRDELCTILTVYWVTGTIGSSIRMYFETDGPGRKLPVVEVPTAHAQFPKEVVRTPRPWAEARYRDIVRWTVQPRGGHFAAAEEPGLLVEDVRAFFRDQR